MSTEKKEKPPKLPLPIKLVVGAVAGVVGTSAIFPLDMLKTRLQSAEAGKYRGPVDCFKQIVASEGGYRALYKGLPANLIGVTPEKAIKLATNEFIRDHFEKDDGSIELVHEMIAGAGAGFCQVIATNPMEITKIRMQMQGGLPAAERLNMMGVVRQLGLRGMYMGSMATLARDVPFSLLFFPGYANIKKCFEDDKGAVSLQYTLLAGGIAGAIAAGIMTPSDVIKTSLQKQGGKEKYKNMSFGLRLILKEEGVRGLYKGIIPRMAVVGPLFAITLLSFEAQKAYMIKNGLL